MRLGKSYVLSNLFQAWSFRAVRVTLLIAALACCCCATTLLHQHKQRVNQLDQPSLTLMQQHQLESPESFKQGRDDVADALLDDIIGRFRSPKAPTAGDQAGSGNGSGKRRGRRYLSGSSFDEVLKQLLTSRPSGLDGDTSAPGSGRDQLIQILNRGLYPPENPQTTSSAPKWLNSCESYKARSRFALRFKPNADDSDGEQQRRRKKRAIKFYTNANYKLVGGSNKAASHNYVASNSIDDSMLISAHKAGGSTGAKNLHRKYYESPTTFLWKTSNINGKYGARGSGSRYFVDQQQQQLQVSPTPANIERANELKHLFNEQLSAFYEIGWHLHSSNANSSKTLELISDLKDLVLESVNSQEQQEPMTNTTLAQLGDRRASWLPSFKTFLDESGRTFDANNAPLDLLNIHQLLQFYALAFEQIWFDSSSLEPSSKSSQLYNKYGNLHYQTLSILCDLETTIGMLVKFDANQERILKIAMQFDAKLASSLKGVNVTSQEVLDVINKLTNSININKVVIKSPLFDEQSLKPFYDAGTDLHSAKLLTGSLSALNGTDNKYFVGRGLMPDEARNLNEQQDRFARDFGVMQKLTDTLKYYEGVIKDLFIQMRALRTVEERTFLNKDIDVTQ